MPVQPVDATPRKLIALSEGGVYDRTESKGAYCGAESRAVETLESKSVNEIGRALGKDHLVVHVLAGHGGVALVYFCDPQTLCSAAQTKTPIACYGNICRKRPTCRPSRSPIWTQSLCVSIPGHDKRRFPPVYQMG